jgi:serine/threonine protein kinase
LAKSKETGDLCALKLMKKHTEYDTGMLDIVKNEVEIMKGLQHKNIKLIYHIEYRMISNVLKYNLNYNYNIINLLDYRDDVEHIHSNGLKKEVYLLALELANGGELFDLIAQTGQFSEPVARYYFQQMIAAFEYLHGNGISHRDMKPENVMLDSQFNLKIADFGFSSNKALNETRRGTDSYMTPRQGGQEGFPGRARQDCQPYQN